MSAPSHESPAKTNRLIVLAWVALAILILSRGFAPHRTETPTTAAPVQAEPVRASLSALQVVKSGGVWNAAGNIVFVSDILIDLPEPIEIRSLDLSLDHNDMYRVEILTADGYIPIGDILPIEGSGLARRQLVVPDLPLSMRATQIRLSALEGDGMYAVGHLVINP